MWFHGIHLITVLIEIYDYSRRSTNGRSRITAYYSETRIGIDSRGLVRRHSHLLLLPSHVSLAEGNPDEEKIGAFGVGKLEHYLEIIDFSCMGSIGFYSLFSITEEPWVTSGGTPNLLSQTLHGSTLSYQDNG